MAAASYETVKTVGKVLVKVPRLGRYMNQLDAFRLEQGDLIPARHQNGMVLEKGHILNRNFYGLEDKDLGRAVIATVQVKTKTTEDGRKFTMVDVTKNADQTAPTTELKLMQGEKLADGDIPIVGSNWIIRFKPRE